MELSTVIELVRSSVAVIIIVASPILLTAMGVGLTISIIQATTSIQEQTLTFVPKLLAIFAILAIFGGWITVRLTTFTTIIFERISGLTT